MRIARFRDPSGRHFGVVEEDHVVRLDHRVPSFEDLLVEPVPPREDDPRVARDELVWEPPLGDHPKVVCVGFNYAAHAAESDRAPDTPGRPTLFARFGDSFVGAGTPVVRPAGEDSLDWEGEAALVIGRPGRRISAERALDHVAGVTCVAENSLRDWQLHSSQATAGKNWHHSGAVGPWIVTLDEVGTGPLRVTTRLNRDVVQDDTTDRLIFPFAELIAYISTFTPLRPGDLVATGTPKGIGLRMDPPRFMRPGDEVEVEVSAVGVLRNGVIDEVIDEMDEASAPETVGVVA